MKVIFTKTIMAYKWNVWWYILTARIGLENATVKLTPKEIL